MNHDELVVEVEVPTPLGKDGDQVPEIQPPRLRHGPRRRGSHHHARRRASAKTRAWCSVARRRPSSGLRKRKKSDRRKARRLGFREGGETAAAECSPVSDIHASEEYRRHVIRILTKRMAKAACEKAKIVIRRFTMEKKVLHSQRQQSGL